MALSVTLDGPTSLGLEAEGFGYDLRPGLNEGADWYFNDAYAWPIGDPSKPSPVTLMPAVLKEEWGTTQTEVGIYARDRLTHYVQADADSWEEYARLHPKDYTFLSKRTDAVLTSRVPIESGVGFVIHMNPFGAQLNTGRVASIRFGSTDDSKKFNLNIFEEGRAFLGRGAGTDPRDQLANGWIVPNRWGSLIGKWLKVMVLPHGRNRLLISSSAGHGFVYEDKSRSRADFSPAQNLPALLGSNPPTASLMNPVRYPQLTDPGLIEVQAHPKMALQIRPLHFVPTGYLSIGGPSVLGGPTYSRQATPVVWAASSPIVGVGRSLLTADTPNGTSVVPSYSAPYGMGDNGFQGVTPTVTFHRPDASEKDSRQTPILYRVEPKADPIHAGKTTTGLDLGADVIEFRHHHDREIVTGSLRLRKGENHTTYRRRFNIPFTWTESGSTFLEAVCIQPTWEIDGAQKFLSFELQDLWRKLETTTIKSLGRLDGMALDEAVKAILVASGWPSDGSKWDIDSTPAFSDGRKAHTLSKGEADDDPTNLADVVKSAADWLRYIWDTYTTTEAPPFQWVMGFQPYEVSPGVFDYRFYFKDPANITQTPVWSFYPDHASAIANEPGVTWQNAYLYVHEGWKDEAIEPEANDVLIVGMDADGKGIFAHDEDKASKDPNTPLNSRPANWVGEPRMYVLIDSSLTTQALCTAANRRLYRRLTKARLKGTFRGQWFAKLLLHRTIRVYQYADDGTLSHDDWRIQRATVDHLQDNAANRFREASIAVERWLS